MCWWEENNEILKQKKKLGNIREKAIWCTNDQDQSKKETVGNISCKMPAWKMSIK